MDLDSDTSTAQDMWHMYKTPIVFGVLSLVGIVCSIVLLVKSTQTTTPIQFSQSDGQAETSTLGTQSANFKAILVDIEGAVKQSGIVSLAGGSRVEDALNAAGGLTGDADENYVAQNINRAMKISDGMKIYVPKVGDTVTSHNFTPLLQRSDESLQNGGGVSVNSASQSELESLPGIGPVTAQKIIDNRPYKTLEDLVAKKAIGPSLFEKLKNTLSL